MPDLSAREVYQQLKDVALGVRMMQPVAAPLTTGKPAGLTPITIEGWALTLFIDGATLIHCETCTAPDGRVGSLDTWQRYGTNPVSLLSQWEAATLERLLSELCPPTTSATCKS